MKNLQPIIDELIDSESGAEMVLNGDEHFGAVADMMISPKGNEVAFRILGPWATMGFDRAYTFPIKDSSFQKDKNRVVMRSTGGTIYVLQPAESNDAVSAIENFPLDKEKKELVRQSLETNFSIG